MAVFQQAISHQTAAFVSPAGGLLAPGRGSAAVPKALGLQQATPSALLPSGAQPEAFAASTGGQAVLAVCLCGIATGLAVHGTGQRRTRRGRGGLRVTSLDRPADAPVQPAAAPLVKGDVDSVESSIAQFVPKISALQNQAELLRSGELRNVIQTMKELRKTELRGVFGEVDQLLCALIDAIDGLRESALEIRSSELRQHFEELERVESPQALPGESAQPLSALEAERQSAVETMMEVHVVGLSHHRAPVEVREKLAVAQEAWNQYAKELVEYARTPNGYVVPEVAVLSTCNRFELYFASPEVKKYPAIQCVHSFLRHQSGLDRSELEPFLFTHSGEDATQHLFEVVSGLDSLVLGEAQILAQVKACHEHCIEKGKPDNEGAVAGSGGKIVAKMLNAAIRTGKLVRTRTKIGKGSVSVSSAAVELMMSKVFHDLRKHSSNVHACIIGAGKMARLLLIALYSKHPDIQLTLVNRSVDKAQALLDEVSNRGGSRATVAPATEMWDVVRNSDVVFTATGSKEPIITKADLHSLERNLMLIDISVPLNIAPDCAEVERVTSYTVDDLKKVVQANAEKRQSEVLKAKRFIAEEVNKYKLWQASQGAVPYLAALKSMAEGIRLAETDKMSKKLNGLDEKERAAVDKLTRHIIDQLFRPIYYSMKDDEEINAKKNKIWALKSMFKLEPEYKRRLLPQGATPAQLPAAPSQKQLSA
mmetsp:Transcript_143731/g.400619  ORF Transcript_143731/g.400619 Transcript_143731/m.400619 type:complete len:708 (-) Transcript_143731:103-2226(-)